jgi:hypothetical protein
MAARARSIPATLRARPVAVPSARAARYAASVAGSVGSATRCLELHQAEKAPHSRAYARRVAADEAAVAKRRAGSRLRGPRGAGEERVRGLAEASKGRG